MNPISVRVTRLAALVAFVFILLAFFGCAGGGALVSPSPTADQVAAVRADAVRLIDALTVGVQILDQAGATANRLTTLSAAEKNAVDCEIAKALGLDAPSAAVLAVCGAIPTTKDAPLRRVRQVLHDVTARPSLQATAKVIIDACRPLWERLQRSSDKFLQGLGIVLQTALQPAQLIGGVS